MPDLLQSLQSCDLGQVQIIAELWGIELDPPDIRRGRKNLAKALLNSGLVSEIVEALPEEAQLALSDLVGKDGRIPWAQFSKRYGDIREMGAGKRDREKPHHNPISTSERLWYRALIARAFLETDSSPQEFAYIPDDILPLLPEQKTTTDIPLSRPATTSERKHIFLANDHILDHTTTLLAAIRLGWDEVAIENHTQDWNIPRLVLISLLKAAGLLDKKNKPIPENIQTFLEAPRGDALAQIARAWLESKEHNDLRLLPHLQAEGEWHNDPFQTRSTILGFLSQLSPDTWWSLPAFISTIHTHHSDFQRPAGDYESWYLRDVDTGEFLRGFQYWQMIDGEMLKYIITGPLHWLGMVDLAAPDKDSPPITFRFSAWMPDLLAGNPPKNIPKEEEQLVVDSQGKVSIPRRALRAVRYQISRFCTWDAPKKDFYVYRITPASLEKAKPQGLKVSHLLTLLRRHTSNPIPPNLVQSLERWEKHGAQASFETVMVLRVKHPDILDALKKSRTSRFLGDPLGPTSVVVKPGAWQKVMEALAEMGYLSEVEDN
jgi:hypothetical protein